MTEHGSRSRGELLVFVHIPKTAGSTLRTVLGNNEPAERSLALGNAFKGGGGISPGVIDRLRKGEGQKLRGVRLVRGHLPLGVREYLPQYLAKSRRMSCFTFLREPAERMLSHFFAVRDLGRGGYQLEPLAADATIDDALEGGHIHDNLHTRMLSGLPEPFGEVTAEMLEQAKRNLREELVFFGLTERFEESLVLAKRRLGFRSILYRSSGRVNKKRPRGADVPAKLRRAAEKYNRYDIQLYDYAKELFESMPERQELDFQVELASLRAARGEAGAAEAPAPPQFAGDEEAWRMLLSARAMSHVLEWELALSDGKIDAARTRARELTEQLDGLRADLARLSELEREVELLSAVGDAESAARRIKAARARAKRHESKGRKRAAVSDG